MSTEKKSETWNQKYEDGTQIWYKGIKKHREREPAVIHSTGTKMWFKDNELHNENGPALIYPDGAKEYYLHNCSMNEEWYKKYQKLKEKYTFIDVPVRDKWAVSKIVNNWFYNPKFKCVQNRLKRQHSKLYP